MGQLRLPGVALSPAEDLVVDSGVASFDERFARLFSTAQTEANSVLLPSPNPGVPLAAHANAQIGIASVYSTKSGSRTASGAKLNPGAFTAAHRSLPFGSEVRVTNRRNGRSIVLTVNDRGPFVRGRVIDVTPAAARALGFASLASVRVERE